MSSNNPTPRERSEALALEKQADTLLAEYAQKIVARRPGPRKRRADGVALRMIGILNPERLHRVEVDEIPLSAIVVDEDDE